MDYSRSDALGVEMDKKEFLEYEKMLVTNNFLTVAINNSLADSGLKIRISSNSRTDCKRNFAQFSFEVEGLPKNKNFIDVIGEQNETH